MQNQTESGTLKQKEETPNATAQVGSNTAFIAVESGCLQRNVACFCAAWCLIFAAPAAAGADGVRQLVVVPLKSSFTQFLAVGWMLEATTAWQAQHTPWKPDRS